jgi:adenylate cyclase
VGLYESGLAAFRARDFSAAIAAFEKVLEIRKDDAASLAMIDRCRQQLENPDGEAWDGTTVARTK